MIAILRGSVLKPGEGSGRRLLRTDLASRSPEPFHTKAIARRDTNLGLLRASRDRMLILIVAYLSSSSLNCMLEACLDNEVPLL